MEKREIKAKIITSTPMADGQRLRFDSAGGRVDILLSDEEAKFLAVVLGNYYGFFQCAAATISSRSTG